MHDCVRPCLWRMQWVSAQIKATLAAHTRRSIDIASAQGTGASKPDDQPPKPDAVGQTDKQSENEPDGYRFARQAVPQLGTRALAWLSMPPG